MQTDTNSVMRYFLLALVRHTEGKCINVKDFDNLLLGIMASKKLIITIRDTWVDISGVIKIKMRDDLNRANCTIVAKAMLDGLYWIDGDVKFKKVLRKAPISLDRAEVRSLLTGHLVNANKANINSSTLISGEDGKVMIESIVDPTRKRHTTHYAKLALTIEG